MSHEDDNDKSVEYWLEHAMNNIYGDYGDRVSVNRKDKDLLKFGRNRSAPNTAQTIDNSVNPDETFLSSNLITSVISDDNSDTVEVVVEGHTIDGNGDFTFVSQAKTLTGQTVATLDIPLARCSRVYNNNSANLVGNIYVTQDDTYTLGVPDTTAKVHAQITAGKNQTEKCSTTISKSDYWIITEVYCDMLTKQSAFTEVEFQVRFKGKVFRTVIVGSASNAHDFVHLFKPYLVVPKNSDVRLQALTDSAGGRDVAAGIEGVLTKVV